MLTVCGPSLLGFAFALLLFMSFLVLNCNATFVYERFTLLNICSAVAALPTCNVCGPRLGLPPSSLPPGLPCQVLPLDLPRRRRQKRRGKCGGIAVRRRMVLLWNYNLQHASLPWGSEFVHGFTAGQCSLDGLYRCLCPILPGYFSAPARIFLVLTVVERILTTFVRCVMKHS